MDTQHCTLTTMKMSRHKLCTLKLCAVIKFGQLFEYCTISRRRTCLLVPCANVMLNSGLWQLGIRYSSISTWVGNRLEAGFASLQGLWYFGLFCFPDGPGAHIRCCTMNTGYCFLELKPGRILASIYCRHCEYAEL